VDVKPGGGKANQDQDTTQAPEMK